MNDPGTEWTKLDPETRERLRRAIETLFANFSSSKRQNDVKVLTWCRALAPYAKGKSLWWALEMACREARQPGIPDIQRMMNGRPETEAFKPIPELTPEERKRADQSAVLSMLWLHYAKYWWFSDFAGTVLARQLGAEPQEALRAAAETYDRATVLAWMAGQIRAGN